MAITSYPKFDSLSVVPAADLISLTSEINTKGPARVGEKGLGKRAGTIVIRDAGSATAPASRYSLVMSTGALASSPWFCVDGSQSYQPV